MVFCGLFNRLHRWVDVFFKVVKSSYDVRGMLFHGWGAMLQAETVTFKFLEHRDVIATIADDENIIARYRVVIKIKLKCLPF